MRRLVYGDPVAGWASTICIIVFIGGIQLFCMGVMGQYIAKNYSESKHRPHYIVSETNKPDAEKDQIRMKYGYFKMEDEILSQKKSIWKKLLPYFYDGNAHWDNAYYYALCVKDLSLWR